MFPTSLISRVDGGYPQDEEPGLPGSDQESPVGSCRADQVGYGSLYFLVFILLFALFRYNNKNYRVDEIDFDQNPSTTFQDHKGREMSFKDYYKEHYNIQIKNLKQPLLITRAKVIPLVFTFLSTSLQHLFPRGRPRRKRRSPRPSPWSPSSAT